MLYSYICMTSQWREQHGSLQKYISHFIWKGCVWEGVGDRTELQHIDPHSYGHNSVSRPFSWAAQPGAWGPNLSGTWSSSSFFSLTGLNFLSPGLYNNLTSIFLLASVTILHSIQPLNSQGYILIFFIYTGAFPILTAFTGWKSIYTNSSPFVLKGG